MLRVFVRKIKESFSVRQNVMETENEQKGELDEEKITLEKKNVIRDFLKPLSTNWQFVEDVLLWKNPLPACVCFLLISGLFWKFLAVKLRKIALVLSGFLLVNAANSEIRTNVWSFVQNKMHLELKEENSSLPFNYEELCLFLAHCWMLSIQHIEFVKKLRTSSSPKFYCLVAVYLFTVLTVWTYIPVAEILYLIICVLFFYPSLRYYGFADKVYSKFEKLTEPVVVHWEHNQTKRTRDTLKQVEADQMESDDEFALERSTYTSTILSSVVPETQESDQSMQSSSESLGDVEIPSTLPPAVTPGEFTDDDDDLHTTDFAQGLSMPSLSQYDSIMEPYDEFHYGLKFPDHDVSLRTLPNQSALDIAPDQYNTDDEIDDLPFEDETEGPSQTHMVKNDGSIEQDGIRHIIVGQSLEYENDSSSDIPELDDTDIYLKAVEGDFEFLEHEELDNLEETNMLNPTTTTVESNTNPYIQSAVNYSQAGISTMSKWLGYN